jgi:uncharacterized protein with NRDE domain
MCLYAFAFKTHPDYPLVIAGNRDELYDRPTAPLGFWQDHPHVLGGRDLKHKGTWLGMSRKGSLALLTNFREGDRPKSQGFSRGHLVSNFLTGGLSPKSYLEKLTETAADYAGFNLLVGDAHGLWYFSNRRPGIQELKPGVYGLSNHLLDTPWPKLSRARAAFEAILGNQAEIGINDLIGILTDRKSVPDKALPQTGIELALERLLATVFVISPGYGTRSSAVILVDRYYHVTFFEQTWQTNQAAATPAGHICLQFTVPSKIKLDRF